MSDISSRISAVIRSSGLTKTAFSKKIGLSQPFVSQLASGDASPSDRTIVDICREFGVSEHWLRTGEGDMFVRLSREEEITKFTMSIIRDPDSEFQRQLLATMAKLEPAQWKLMEQMLDDLISQREKKEGT
nr:MAG TPA: Helix-turn-helix XRE-family like protein [Bacteriophage sp.]